MKFLFYDLWTANDCGIKEHPQAYMLNNFKVIHSVPQSIAGGWWFCVEDFDFELPEFLTEMKPYNLNYWKDKCYNNCDFFKRSFDCTTQKRDDRYCCCGGYNCLKEKFGTIENFEKEKRKN